ncbi:MAG TPA: P-II family nitrogen regulator [Acidimicrobiales bacterium]|nr:P-II family nitrogen regulator [Acidimicrobiales bacterium]
MKLVTAVIAPHVLERVKDALVAAGVHGMTVTEVRGFGRQSGHTETYRGAEYALDFVPKLRIDIVVDLFDAESITEVLVAAARTGQIGDGKVWITDVERAVRIRTGERGTDALT